MLFRSESELQELRDCIGAMQRELERKGKAHKIWYESVMAELRVVERQRDEARAELKGWRDCVGLYVQELDVLGE